MDVYQTGTKASILSGWYTRNELTVVNSIHFKFEDVSRNKYVTLRESSTTESLFAGQRFSKCLCQPSKKQCSTNRCACYKTKKMCNSKCHNSNACLLYLGVVQLK